MKENNENKVTVVIDNYEGIADMAPVGTFVFSILCMCFWAANIGIVGEGAGLAIGLVQLAVFVPYIITGIGLMKKGLVLGGNTYVLFGAVFGSIGGAFNTFSAIFAHMGIPFDYSIVGYAFLASGVYLFAMLPALAHTTKVDFCIFLFGAIGVTGSALITLGILPAGFSAVVGWVLFIDGIFGFYSVFAGVNNSFGLSQWPLGAPVVKEKESIALVAQQE